MAKHITTTNGVDAFKALLATLRDKADADLAAYWTQHPDAEGTDGRDYKALSEIVLADLRKHLLDSDSPDREGYLRALVSVLVWEAEEGESQDEHWDPIGITARAFAAPQPSICGVS